MPTLRRRLVRQLRELAVGDLEQRCDGDDLDTERVSDQGVVGTAITEPQRDGIRNGKQIERRGAINRIAHGSGMVSRYTVLVPVVFCEGSTTYDSVSRI